jgi:hypothetical protein
MREQFGSTDFVNAPDADAFRLRLSDGPLEISWQHCSLASDFLGDFYAARAVRQQLNEKEARHSIGYMANELLENAVKFRFGGDILVEATLERRNFELRISNGIAIAGVERFQELLVDLTRTDPGDLLIQRIEQNALDPGSTGSGLGILTLMSDYGVRLGWKFIRQSDSAVVRLETCAAFSLT